MLPLEGTLLEKLRKIEALHAGTKVDGELYDKEPRSERAGSSDRLRYSFSAQTPGL